MRHYVRIAAIAAAISLYGASAGAQEAQKDDANKPGGINKVARDVSATAKKAGRDTKAEVRRGTSKAHNGLTDAGNETKAVLKKTTGIKAPQRENPGGLNKVARNVSKASKKAGSDVKGALNGASAEAHSKATEAGKSLKDTTLKGKP